ncbi:hypothetical protein QBC32DRAFT_207178 [Pseudoneurospora amorphoporcata]|uniref:Uncharacterized protein n=1 Tax=Pseudoneurospora amorphoporcata TaxID=241081 RepID=A0AAN6P0Y9_9PEZI|nr:hypothetical protein QBC32DRAFT_207178 [Pseudoneurospora amorphoporcata]
MPPSSNATVSPRPADDPSNLRPPPFQVEVRRRASELGIMPSAASYPAWLHGPQDYHFVSPSSDELDRFLLNTHNLHSPLRERPSARRSRSRHRAAHITIQEPAFPPGERMSYLSRRNRSLWSGLSSRSVSPSLPPPPTQLSYTRAGARTRIPLHMRSRVNRELSEVRRAASRTRVQEGFSRAWAQRIGARVRCEEDYNFLMEQVELLTQLG